MTHGAVVSVVYGRTFTVWCYAFSIFSLYLSRWLWLRMLALSVFCVTGLFTDFGLCETFIGSSIFLAAWISSYFSRFSAIIISYIFGFGQQANGDEESIPYTQTHCRSSMSMWTNVMVTGNIIFYRISPFSILAVQTSSSSADTHT